MGNWISSIVDLFMDFLYDTAQKPQLRSMLKKRSKSKKQLFEEKLQPQVTASVRHKSFVRASLVVPGPDDVPQIFTSPRALNVEWNLCDKVDPARRVDVVGDHKLLRKRQKVCSWIKTPDYTCIVTRGRWHRTSWRSCATSPTFARRSRCRSTETWFISSATTSPTRSFTRLSSSASLAL